MQKNYNTKTAQVIQQFIDTHENQQLSVVDVVSYMEENDCKDNLTTIYRNLDKLVEKNKIVCTTFPQYDWVKQIISKIIYDGTCCLYEKVIILVCAIIINCKEQF